MNRFSTHAIRASGASEQWQRAPTSVDRSSNHSQDGVPSSRSPYSKPRSNAGPARLSETCTATHTKESKPELALKLERVASASAASTETPRCATCIDEPVIRTVDGADDAEDVCRDEVYGDVQGDYRREREIQYDRALSNSLVEDGGSSIFQEVIA